MTPEELRANEFKQLIENPRLKEAFEEIEREAFEELASLKMGEASQQQKDTLIHRIQIIRDLWTRISHNGLMRATKVQQVV
ncbi:hypothetical protein [Brucella pituitosa]